MDEFERLWADIGTRSVMVLSTCADGRPYSRSMSVVVYDWKFFCQTNREYPKCRHIENSPYIALCFGKYSVEGKCRISGRPFDDTKFIKAMEKAFPDAVKRWSALPEECVLEMTPDRIRSWVYEDNIPYIETWDFKTHRYKKERQ